MSKFTDLCKDFNKKNKEVLVQKGLLYVSSNKIPFSSPRLNYMTYGGVPRGRIIEFSGKEGGGKTTTAIDVVRNALRIFKLENPDSPKQILYLDCENTLDSEWAKTLGVNLEEITLLKPIGNYAEELFQFILESIETGEIGLVVIDSLGVMVSKQSMEKSIEDKTYGGISMALTKFSEVAVQLCYGNDCTIVAINQMRADMNSQYGGTITTGGKAFQHNCSMQMEFQKGDYLDSEGTVLTRKVEDPYGNLVMVSLKKTKVCKPNRRTGSYTLSYTEGIDYVSDLIDVAIKYSYIIKSGAWFVISDPETGEVVTGENEETLKFHGRASLKKYLLESDAVFERIREQVESNFI